MQQVFNLFEKWAGRQSQKPAVPAQSPRMLSFDFVGEEPAAEPALPAYEASADNLSIGSCLGRAESCLSVAQLSDAHCLDNVETHQSSNVVYLQKDARQEQAIASPTRKARRPQQQTKVRATAMLDASELLEMRKHNSGAYSRISPEQSASKQVSLEVLRKLGQRSSREEMLEKIKDVCDKVSAEALINSPGRRPQTGPLRQTICIQIG
jgi:hypothetical protein